MITPIATKNLGDQNEWGLPAVMKIWEVNINAKAEMVTVHYEVVTTTPSGIEDVRVTSFYKRFNSRKGDIPNPGNNFRGTTKDNLKFDELRASEVGQGIMYLISLDVANFDGTPGSIAQVVHTEPQPEDIDQP